MELQGLQEALKVEIQCHQKLVAQMKQDPQNGDLKKQIHERQSRISALNEKQKLAIRNCPMGSVKPIPLIKAPSSQSLAISIMQAKAPVTMVTAHINGSQKSAASANLESQQTAPINLQTSNKLMGNTLNLAGRRVPEVSHSQTMGTIAAVPIKVPQVSSLQRLAGHGPAVLPQVRPKTLIPDSLPISSCRDQPSKQPSTFQKATVVSIKNPSPALPTANNTFNHIQMPNGQSQSVTESTSISSTLSSAGVAYAIISTSSNNATPINTNTVSVVSDGIKVQPLLICADSKVIIIQPQVQTQPERKASNSDQPSQGPLATKKKKDESPEKIAFMVALGLVTTEHLEEIQSKRQERKRRSTANPAYSGLLEPERKRVTPNYLNNPFSCGRANEDSCWKNEITHDEHCAACKRGCHLQPCGTCPRAYHLNCLEPPLKSAPKGAWVCPKCQQKVLKKDDNVPWTGTLDIAHSYVNHKTVKEEEKRKLIKRGSELKNEHRQLEDKDRLLSNVMQKCLEQKNNLLTQQKETLSSLERLKTLIRLIQNEQMIQVTMTTTTTSSLLTVPWIKPSSASTAMHKALQHSQGKN
ncbi:PHD finger protein 21B [Rhinatrema bivittatum]|uniref:PHD finger protein 21B n=1 Tax=Rhinatrema bivittatum TaxID=194408 RepID=UPI00112667EB|nr:PHD finger protein 21B [Rhinatrema bivittatum]